LPGRNTQRARKRPPKTQLLILLSVLGPGIIAANADNDASGIYGYSLAGAQYGYGLLWVLVLVTISLGVCQEMCARMGAVTGKGLADLIREEYGVKVTLFAMATLLIANYATTVSEFAGITAAVEIFAPPRLHIRWIVVPLVAAGVWLLVTRGSYRRVERILLTASLIYLAYIASAFMANPPWGTVLSQTLWPGRIHFTTPDAWHDYIFMVINVIGTTITPWGQFYIQSSVRDKGIRAEQYGYTRTDVLFGAFFTNFIAFFIIVCCAATLYHPGQPAKFDDAGQVALALKPIAGRAAAVLFAIGLFNASCFGAITVPLSTAYAFAESLGWESGLGRRVREAPLFVGVFTLLIVVSAITVLFGGSNLQLLIILPNIVGGILLPIILILMLRLINNRRLMGDYVNSRIYNIIAWITTVVLIALSAVLVYQPLADTITRLFNK
jgi:Mn2+/Fe2+ NRAMP family transporter